MGLSESEIKRLSPEARRQIAAVVITGVGTGGKERKYSNEPCEYADGERVIRFDSKRELERYTELRILERSGVIRDLRRQVEYVLIPAMRRDDGTIERACKYIADFVYFDSDAEKTIVEDVKGYRDPASAGYAKFVIKRKLMLERYGITVREV